MDIFHTVSTNFFCGFLKVSVLKNIHFHIIFKKEMQACMFIVSDRAMRWWLICVDGIRLYSVEYEITSIGFLGTDQRILQLSRLVSARAVSR